jgi:hypothetical protein
MAPLFQGVTLTYSFSLETLGRAVNHTKTELFMFYKNDLALVIVSVDSVSIKLKKNFKILGVIFDSRLNWSGQATSAIYRATNL